MRATTRDDVNAFIADMERNSILNNRNISVMRFSVPLDNHNPIREHGAGYIIRYTNDHVDTGYVLFHDMQFGTDTKLVFLIDDGKTVRPFYLASWNVSGGFYILHPITVGSEFGPRKMYHVMLAPDATTVLAEFSFGVQEIELHDFPYVAHTSKPIGAHPSIVDADDLATVEFPK